MGKITKPKGLKGGLGVVVYNEVNSSLDIGKRVWIRFNSNKYHEMVIESIFISGKKSWLKFLNYDTRDQVYSFIGLEFSLSRGDLKKIKKDDIYLIDYIGVTVLDESLVRVGEVVDTMVMPAHNMLMVKTIREEVMIPLVEDHIKLFDKEKNVLILKNVEGLLD